MIIRLTLPMMFALAFVALAACGESPPPSPAPTVTPTVAQTSTPVPTPSPTPVVPFEESLSSADVARFQDLPVEIQEALVDESLESGNDGALRYLRDMPDDPAPLSAILGAETLSLLDTIDEPNRRQLLLEGYPNSTIRHFRKQWLAGEFTDLEYEYGDFGSMVHHLHRTLSEDGHLLPPLEDALSPAAFSRFESLDPLLQASFRIVWETRRATSPSDAADRLEQKLLNMPTELPGIRALGLSEEAAYVLEREPEMRDYALGKVAAVHVNGNEWDDEHAARLQQTIEAYEAPGGREALARGLRPGVSDPWLATIACQPSGWGPIPLDSAIPRPFRGVHPAQLVYAWPAPEDSLSDAALANFHLLDETMREALEYWWYGPGPLPMNARTTRCEIARWDRGIADTPFTSMPDPDVFLSADMSELYAQFSDYGKEVVQRHLVSYILKGEVRFKRERFASTEKVSTLDSTREEFLDGLRFWADEWVTGWACHIEELDCSGS
ncbi:MAG: hypothetical protein OXD46_15110 [Chloroflexi bacterium]|nr:hypothetical protein [Chloroflexota bacterium]